MVVRIRITRGAAAPAIKSACASVFTLAAVACFITGVWILASGMGWAGAFVIERGAFSHWQVWMALGVFAQLCSFRLTRVRPKPVRANGV